MRKTILVTLILGFGLSAFGSFGTYTGGEKRKETKTATLQSKNFSNFKTSLDFSLKNIQYKGSYLLQVQRSEKIVVLNSLVTYNKGNVIYVIPYKQSFLQRKFKTPTPIK